MNNKPSQLARVEKRRSGYIISTMLIPIVGVILGIIVLGGLYGIALGFFLGCIVTWRLIILIYKYVKVACPKCGSDAINENYANCSRYSDQGVEHNCESCGAKYKDGIEIEEHT